MGACIHMSMQACVCPMYSCVCVCAHTLVPTSMCTCLWECMNYDPLMSVFLTLSSASAYKITNFQSVFACLLVSVAPKSEVCVTFCYWVSESSLRRLLRASFNRVSSLPELADAAEKPAPVHPAAVESHEKVPHQ